MLLTTANNDKMQSLEKRVEALEKIVWRLEDYIEN
jgi:polyhydroxyalkanoate synthesis regulator phasin